MAAEVCQAARNTHSSEGGGWPEVGRTGGRRGEVVDLGWEVNLMPLGAGGKECVPLSGPCNAASDFSKVGYRAGRLSRRVLLDGPRVLAAPAIFIYSDCRDV